MSSRIEQLKQLQWEVRSPLVYGLQHEGFFDTEAQAIAFAREYIEAHCDDGARMHTVDRVIYIQDDLD
jgi:hypothetical protein